MLKQSWHWNMRLFAADIANLQPKSIGHVIFMTNPVTQNIPNVLAHKQDVADFLWNRVVALKSVTILDSPNFSSLGATSCEMLTRFSN